MKVDERTPRSVHQGGLTEPPRVGFAPNTPPEEPCLKSNIGVQKGVSTKNAFSAKDTPDSSLRLLKSAALSPLDQPHWYTLRTTYGRERMAYDYLTAQGLEAYYPTHEVVKIIGGKRRCITESLLPNLFLFTPPSVSCVVTCSIMCTCLTFVFITVTTTRVMPSKRRPLSFHWTKCAAFVPLRGRG